MSLPMNNSSQSQYVCDLMALDPSERKRHGQLSAELWPQRLEMRELANGYEFRFRPLLFEKIAEWVSLERLCCSFLDIGPKLEKNRGPLWVQITGDIGIKRFLQDELNL